MDYRDVGSRSRRVTELVKARVTGQPFLSLTYLLNPSRVLVEKLSVFHPVKKFPAFYGTRRFITAVTSARHLSLS
jgi:hypothetical protein